MTYCVGILLKEGLVCAADTRSNAGVDQVATFRKLNQFEEPGERVMILMSAGNLATSQAVVSLVTERLEERGPETSLYRATSMYQAARIVGNALREVLETDGPYVRAENADPTASFILGGQIQGRPPRLFLIYTAGNFVEASPETPFLQVGETKYGKPILDRVIRHDMPLRRAAMGALLSFDSTMRSNLSVAPPIDVVCYRADSLRVRMRLEVREHDAYFSKLRRLYGTGISRIFDRLPEPDIPD